MSQRPRSSDLLVTIISNTQQKKVSDMSSSTTKARELMDAVNATFGKDTISMASNPAYKVEYISTGLLPFDILLQGGMPRGRFVQIHGDYSTLKSYIGLCTARETQRMGGVAAFIDNEHSFDPAWAESVGVNVADLIVKRPATGEEAIDIMEVLVKGGVDFICFDSVAAALPQAETLKRLHGESMQPGRLAQLMSAAMRRLTTINQNTSILWINQTRQNIGITFGSNEALPGGKALPYYSSYIMSVRKTGKITRDIKFFDGEKWAGGKEQIGQKFKAEVIKSKLSQPFRDIWFHWNLENGQIDIPNFLMTQGIEHGFVDKAGNTWTAPGIKAVGREKFMKALAENQEAMDELEDRIREVHGLPVLARPKKAARTVKSIPAKKTMKRVKS